MSFDISAVTAGVVGANDTKYPICPAGEYPAVVDKYEGRQMSTANGISTILDITWVIMDEDVKKTLGMERPTVRQSVFLDLTGEGRLDTSAQKNIKLGRLREALHLNDPSKEFSFDQMVGVTAMVTIGHTVDKNDSEVVYANVTKVGSL